jgi:hypothetical protein
VKLKRNSIKQQHPSGAVFLSGLGMARSFYLPELHAFEYIAQASWPTMLNEHDQLDWVSAVECMEVWLNRFCGSHYSEWAYHNGTSVDYWQACIAFRRERNRTLFLLTWA